MGVQATPTQEENDLAKLGIFVPVKEWDGSPVDPNSPDPTTPPQVPPDPEPPDPEPGVPPVVTSISPTTTNTGSQKISVRGTGFTPASKIVFNGAEQVTTVQTLEWLQATITKPGVGFYDVWVRDAGGDSNKMQFQFK